MKTVSETYRFFLTKALAVLVLLTAPAMMVWAQEMNEKFSMTTQMFLNEQKAQPIPGTHRVPIRRMPNGAPMQKPHRLIASPDTVGGVAYISCFIHLKDLGNLSEVRALGVEVEETFDGLNFVTARVPVDQLEPLADIDNVTKIKVAQRMRLLTNAARQCTNVDDLLTQSADATALGINSKYDGTGVVLGVIDTGIDFQHIAFKDKNGNSRIKRAYVYDGWSATEYTESNINSATTDDEAEDHGTHTASTAGGSSVIVNGTNVTVTDDHANATYGGMAPGADLYLAGINSLSDTYLSNALKKMVAYADEQGKPLVVSNSWGSGWGPRDGTGEWANLVAQYFGDSHPNHVILFASSNDAGHENGNEGGGYFVKKSSVTSSSPLGTIIRTDGYGGDYYQGLMACAWSSSSNNLRCKIYVLDNSTGEVLKYVTISGTTSSISGLSSYYAGTLSVSMGSENGKYCVALNSDNGMSTKSDGAYTLAIEVYPNSGSTNINMWSGDWTFFTNHLTTSGHTWLAGTDDMCVSDEATIPDVISVGAYVSKNQWTDYNNNSWIANSYTVGDIAYFSSYATAEQSPTGVAYPWITAPGARLAAGVNHHHTASVDSYSYYGSNYDYDLVVNSTNNPYAMMEGTSMATPVAAGIVALWLQASMDDNAKTEYKNCLTVNKVKEIMEQTAINDSYTTTGTNASHFGKGKIDALAGIQYILGTNTGTQTTTEELIDFTEQGFANAEAISSVDGTNCTVTFDKGTNSNKPTYYTSGTAIRAYGGNTMTVASTTKTIVKIELTFGSGDGSNAITTNVESYNNGTWTGSASSVTFTIGGTSGNRRIKQVKVYYGAGTTPVDPATAYYQPADGKKGSALKTAMSAIILPHTQRTYDNLWDDFFSTDVRSDGKIWDMYSSITNYTPVTTGSSYTKEGDCYNREHSFPQSWFGSNSPMYTDLHHIYPTDGFVNGKRANFPFGETNGETYKSANDFSKLGPCTYPGYNGTVFEPADEYKGDFARTYFYMVTCYEDQLPTWYSSYTESRPTLDGNKYPGLSDWQLSMLMEWAKNDPVSEKEVNRNNAVYGIQENRNPFIDYPGLEEYVWGFMTTTAFSYDNYQVPVYKQDVTMAFSPTEASATIGEAFTAPTLTIDPAGLTVTYSSSDETVATVDASTGEVTLVAAGTATITATFAGNDTYNGGTASYTLTVSAAPTPNPGVGTGKYALVTDASTLKAGDKILIACVNGTTTKALGTTQNTNNRAAVNITKNSDGTLTPDATAQVITLEKDGDYYLFNVGNGYLYAASSSANYLKTQADADDDAKATISISNSNNAATIAFIGTTRNIVRYNPNNNNPIFSCYASTSTVGSLPQIYREIPLLTLTDEGTANSATIAAYNKYAANVTLSGRTLYKDGEWNTICLPFDVTLAGSPLEGAVAKTLSDATMTGTHVMLYFSDVTTLSAGKPYIIKWASGNDIVNPTFNNVTVVNTTAADRTISKANGNVKFIGYYDAFGITAADDDIYYMTTDGLRHTGNDRTLRACRAYFQFSAAAAAREFVLDFGEGETTGISDAQRQDLKQTWHSLDGRRLDQQPTRKGLYINNGRKVIVK